LKSTLLKLPSLASVLTGTALAFALSAGAQQAAPLITQRIDDTQLTILKANTPSLARAEYDKGAVSDSTPANRILLVLTRSKAQEQRLNTLMDSLHDKNSASYHKWLKPNEFGEDFGPALSDVETVKAWLQSKGFIINKVNAGRTLIDFSGSAGQLRSAFHTELHTYVHNGVTFHANSSDPRIPTALAPLVKGFAALNDVRPTPFMTSRGRAMYSPRTHRGTPLWTDNFCDQANNSGANCTVYLPTPADIATQYNVSPVYKGGNTGAGETIGIVSASNVDISNVQNYRTFFNLANPSNVPQVIVDGEDPGQLDGVAEEAYLDVEVSGALAPAAAVDLYVSADTLTTTGLYTALTRAVDDDVADVISVSYGYCEAFLGVSGNQFFYQTWQQAAAQGQSVFVATGDSGSAGCDSAENYSPAEFGLAVSGFASTPFNVAVGGTDFYYSQYAAGYGSDALNAQLAQYWGGGNTINPTSAGNLLSPIPEQPWNDMLGLDVLFVSGYGSATSGPSSDTSIAAGSGGPSSCATGSCTGYPKPSWQTGKGVLPDGTRDLPDVAFFASDGINLSAWPICVQAEDCTTYTTEGGSIGVTTVGGTSASSPAMAGIMALVDAAQKGRQGNPNYMLYALAAKYPNSFNDVTVGSNNVICYPGSTADCTQDANDSNSSLQLYPATVGYDMASGLGSVNVANLITNWATIKLDPTTTTLSLSSTTVTHGSPVMATALVSSGSGTPTGSVALVSTNVAPAQVAQGSINLTNGTGTSPVILPGGAYSLTANYSGDGTFGSSASSPVSVTVASEISHATLSVNALLPNYEGSYNVTPVTNGTVGVYGFIFVLDVSIAGVSGQGVPTGSVTFTDQANGTTLGTANLNSEGVAEIQTYAIMGGNHTIIATYSGDSSFNSSLSSSVSFSLTQGTTYLYSNDDSWAVPVYAGQPFLVPFLLGGGNHGVAPTGNVVVNFGSQTVTVPISPTVAYGQPFGTGTATFKNLAPGNYDLNLSYAGDANYAGTTADSGSISVVAAPTNLLPSTTTITSSTYNAGSNGTFTMTVTVAGNGTITPTGQVYFYSNGQLIAGFIPTISLQNGAATATMANSNLFTGVNPISASYLGDANYAASNSAQVPVTANEGDFSITTASPDLAISPGSAGTATIATASLTGLGGTVSLACATSSSSLLCSISPSSFTLATDGAQSLSKITINTQTTTTSTASIARAPINGSAGKWLAAGGLTLALFFLWIPVRRRKLLSAFAVLLLLAAFGLSASGCGSGSKTTTTPTQPTGPTTSNAAPGTYNVAVTASDGGVIHTLNLKVTVQ